MNDTLIARLSAVAAAGIMALALLATPSEAAVSPSLVASRSTVSQGEAVTLSGRVPPRAARVVKLQVRRGGSWVSLAQKRSSRVGRFTFRRTMSATGSFAFRVLAPRAKVSGRTRAGVITPVATVRVVAPAIVVGAAPVTVSEGAAETFPVRLSARPLTTTVVAVTSSDAGAATVSPTTLTFSTSNWGTPQNVVVSGVQDDDVTPEPVTVSVAASGMATRTLDVTVADDDAQGLVVSPATVAVQESGVTGTFGVRLAQQPDADVTVSLASSDPAAVGVAPSTMTFTPANWDQSQSAAVSGLDDPDLTDESVPVTVSAPGVPSTQVQVSVDDPDVPHFVMPSGPLSVTEGSSNLFQVRLSFQPEGSVPVSVFSSAPGTVTALPVSLTFTPANWNQPQTVFVSGVQDPDVANGSAAVTVTSPVVNFKQITVNVVDDDQQGIEVTSPTALEITLAEGATSEVDFRLRFQPQSEVTVSASSADAATVNVSPTTRSFTPANYDVPQAVTVGALADRDSTDETVQVTLTLPGAPPVTVTVRVDDVISW